MSITKKISGKSIKIYINNILHIAIPKSNTILLQSWYEDEGCYKIEIQAGDYSDWYMYEDYNMWKRILKLLDEEL